MSRFAVAPLDQTAKIVTLGVGMLFLLILATIWLVPDVSDAGVARIYPTIVLLVIVVVCYGLKPSAYLITDKKLLIKRPLWSDAEFSLKSLSSAEKTERISTEGLWRTFGNGGLFGYYGYFRNRELGAMTWYLTRRTQLILLKIGSEHVLISPADPDAFLSALEAEATFGKI